MRRMVLVCGLIGLLIGGRADAGPRIPPGEEQRIVDEHLAAPRHYDIYHGKRDRQYLTGVWKLKLEWNYLTKEWIGRNMVDDRSGKAPMVVLKEGVEAPYREIRPGPEHLDVSADLSGWWDVLVPSPWNQGMPYEEPDDRELCDYYVRAKDMYAIGGVGFYRKTFLVPKEKAGLRVVLHFDSVESTCTVWVNGKRVGEHANWRQQGSARVPGAFMDYFDLDVTDAIRAGDENVVTVRAYDSGVPFYWETPDPGGITGLVWVEYFPPAYFEKVRVSAPFGEDRLTVDCLPAEGVSAPDHVRVQVRPWESADYAFAGRGNSYRADVDLGPEHDGGWRRFEMAVPRIRSWPGASQRVSVLRRDRAHGAGGMDGV